jgi:hypothetical protein
MANPITLKNFNGKLAAVVKSAETMRANLQTILIFGLDHYANAGNGDSGCLTRTMNACIGVKALPTRTMQKFIEAHSNVVWSKLKDGTHGFKKVKGEDHTATVPAIAWWNFDNSGQAKVDIDIVKRLESLVKGIAKAGEEGRVTAEQADMVGYVTGKLAELLTGAKMLTLLPELMEGEAANEVDQDALTAEEVQAFEMLEAVA